MTPELTATPLSPPPTNEAEEKQSSSEKGGGWGWWGGSATTAVIIAIFKIVGQLAPAQKWIGALRSWILQNIPRN